MLVRFSYMDKMLNKRPDKGYAYVWDGTLLYAPTSLSNSLHAHFAATVLIAMEQPLRISLQDGQSQSCEIAVLAPNVQRATDSRQAALVDFLIDPDDDLYRYIHPLLGGQSLTKIPQKTIADFGAGFRLLFEGALDCDAAYALVCDVLKGLCPQPLEALPWDARVQEANRFMRDCLPDHVPSIPEVAAEVGLSESRFMHLFREQMGLPVRQYLLWLRIRYAMRFWAQGCSLSEIALAAGFYDQAHFSRTMRRMTDYAPSMLSDPQAVVRVDCGVCRV